MASVITIRPILAGDLETVQALFQKEMGHNGFIVPEDSPYHPANAAIAALNASINAEDSNCGWLAFSGDAPAGIITTPQDLAGGVFVSDDFRGQGIAQMLIRERETYFKDVLGLNEIERPVRADNAASIKLHTEKLGYHFSQATMNLLRATPNPPGHTVLYLAKTL